MDQPPATPTPVPDGTAGPGEPALSAPPSPSRRRWPVVVTLVAALVVALVGAAAAVQQRQVADGWRARADRFEVARDDAIGRGEALQRQLDEVAEALATSEGDVVALEDRLEELADEKAQAEDVATTTTVERDTLVELSNAIAGSVTSLSGCVDELFVLLNDSIDAFNRQGAGETVDVGPLNAARTDATDRCNDARQDAAAAAATAEQLLR